MNIKSSVGYSPTIPPMLNNSRDIMNAKQNMKKIKNMMVAVTASWCGACHNISDDLNKAIRDPNNTSPGTRIDEKMLGKFNRVLKTPIEPPHFPYFVVIDEQGRLKEVLETMEAVKQFLKSSGSASLPLPPPPAFNSTQPSSSTGAPPSPVNAVVPSYVPSNAPEEDSDSDSDSDVPNGANLSILSNASGMPTGVVSKSMTNGEQGLPMSLSSKKSSTNSSTATMINSAMSASASTPVPSIMKMPPVAIANMPNVGKGSSANMKSAVPPSRESDTLSPMGTSNPLSSSNSQKGGYLYESLAAAAYQLAPPAVLLGIAAATLRRRRGRKAKKTRRGPR